MAISAARALFSYGPQKPPAEETPQAGLQIPTWFLRDLERLELARLDVVGGVVASFALLDLPKLRESCDAAWRDAANAFADAKAKSAWQAGFKAGEASVWLALIKDNNESEADDAPRAVTRKAGGIRR